jgi:hypothetical protein
MPAIMPLHGKAAKRQAGFPPDGGLFWRGRRLLLVRGRCFFCALPAPGLLPCGAVERF